MRRSYFIVAFLGLMGVAVSGYAAIKLNLFPVALVNRSFIPAKDFKETVASVEHYYRAAEDNDVPSENVRAASLEIARATLDKMVENALIEDELEKRMAGVDLVGVISKKIGALEEVETPQFAEAVRTLYGISAERFRELVLEPKAREEVLEGNLTETGGTLGDVVLKLRQRARVRILVPGLHWEDGTVIVRGR